MEQDLVLAYAGAIRPAATNALRSCIFYNLFIVWFVVLKITTSTVFIYLFGSRMVFD